MVKLSHTIVSVAAGLPAVRALVSQQGNVVSSSDPFQEPELEEIQPAAPWKDLGMGCCVARDGYEFLYDGNVDGGVEACKRKCQTFSRCAYVNFGWKGSAWCSVMGLDYGCAAIVSGPNDCGSGGNSGVHAWKYQGDPTSVDNNMCLDGRFAPEVFLIGAQKAGTSELAVSLNRSRYLHFGSGFERPASIDSQQKESHVFESDDFNKGKQWWLSHYPQCSSGKRQVFFDGTPDYLLMKDRNEISTSSAARMMSFYGSEYTRLKLLVMVREPLQRMQSAFYHMVHDGFCTFQGGFSEYVQHYFNNCKVPYDCEPCNIVKESLYGSALAKWNYVGFGPGQFTIIPIQIVSTPQKLVSLTRNLWSVIGIDSGYHHVFDDVLNAPDEPVNEGSHPSIEKDLTQQQREQMVQHMVQLARSDYRHFVPHLVPDAKMQSNTYEGVLAELLVNDFPIYGYSDGHNAHNIERYLRNMW